MSGNHNSREVITVGNKTSENVSKLKYHLNVVMKGK